MDRAPFNIGEQVFDQEDDDPDTAVVTIMPDITAEDWEIPHLEKTVAEDNPDYPADASIVFILFEHQIDSHFPDWDRDESLTIDALLDAKTNFYVFPAQRLKSLTSGETEAADGDETDGITRESADGEQTKDESSLEPPAAVRDLKETLTERGMSAEIEADRQTITTEKLGVTYRVQPGEVIEGDGPHREQIEQIVAEV